MRRGQIFALVGIGVLAGGITTAVAVFLPWLPTPASKEAHRIFDAALRSDHTHRAERV